MKSQSALVQAPDRHLKGTVFFFAAILALTLLLRLPYSGHLFHDDGLWFTAAEEILGGKTLYREIYLDKPPIIAFVYAALFQFFGTKIIVMRVFTIFYSVAISVLLYVFGKRLYDRRAGMLAALMFTFFATTSVNSHVQGLNTDFLVLLPYSAAALMFVRAAVERSRLCAFAAGALTGLAVQTNPKAIFNLVFFAMLLVLSLRRRCASEEKSRQSSLPVVALAATGFIAGFGAILIYPLATSSFSDYWVYVWKWGSGYAGYRPLLDTFTRGGWLTLKYFIRDNTLLIALVFVAATTVRRARKQRSETIEESLKLRSNGILLLWLAASYAGVAVGGRFYSNYFFQILPALSLIGARGIIDILSALKSRPAVFRRAAIAVIAAGFIATVAVFHTRTATLAIDRLRAAPSEMNRDWYHEELNREERMVAAVVREWPGGAEAVAAISREAIRDGSPRERGAQGSADYLFVWGARAEIYYWSGLLPASRFLTAQPLTGVPSDVHHLSDSRPVLSNEITSALRAELVRELESVRPRYIVDEIGFYNEALSLQSFPETRELMKSYRYLGATGRFLIYKIKTHLR